MRVCPRHSTAFSGRRGKSEKGEREDKGKRSECDVTGGPTGRLCQQLTGGGGRGAAEGETGRDGKMPFLFFVFSLPLHRVACTCTCTCTRTWTYRKAHARLRLLGTFEKHLQPSCPPAT